MKFISLDLETTSVRPEDGQILSIGAVIEDTKNLLPIEKLPSFYCEIKYSYIKGEPYALNMNKDIIERIAKGNSENAMSAIDMAESFEKWLIENNIPPMSKLKIVGKNASTFDVPWVKEHWAGIFPVFRFHHRVMDVGSLMVDFKNDEWIPDLKQCMERCGINEDVSHHALKDARDVIRVLRTKY